MLTERLPAALSLHKLRHHERDVQGLFFPDNRDLITQIKTLADSKYSGKWRGWYLPCTETHLRSGQKLFQLGPFSLDHLALISRQPVRTVINLI